VAEQLVIIGAGGFGRETVDVVEAVNAAADAPVWDLLGVVDDAPSQANLDRLARRGVAFLGTSSHLTDAASRPRYVVGIGSPIARRALAIRMDAAGFRAATLIHPEASFGSCIHVGEGTVVLAGARLTTNISLGRHVHLNPNVTIGHDTIVEDFVSMNPSSSVSGDCVVETGALIGVGAVVLNQLTVGAGALVGAGACVVRDVEAGVTVKGVPAR
jgi:sugar O-acyltransferase (sialic acid O-acetyltransferase NeuD family)